MGGRRRALSFLSTHASCPSPSFSRSLNAFLSPEHSGYWRPSKGLRGCKRERHRWALEKKKHSPSQTPPSSINYPVSPPMNRHRHTPSAASPQHPFMHLDRPTLGLYGMHSPVPYKTRCSTFCRDHRGKCWQHYTFNGIGHSLATSLPLFCPTVLVVCETLHLAHHAPKSRHPA